MTGAPHLPAPSTPLVGRDRELATLRAHLDAALAGHGRLVLIGGEAGIGKTALAEARWRRPIATSRSPGIGEPINRTSTT